MTKKVLKNNEKPEFFTETVLCFFFQEKEYKVRLGIYGILKTQLGKSQPIITKHKILKVTHLDKEIKCSDGLEKHVNKWIKNNPSKFNVFLITELSPMLLLSKTPPNKQLSQNDVDNP